MAVTRNEFSTDSVKILQMLLSNTKVPVNLTDEEGNTPLHVFLYFFFLYFPKDFCKKYKPPNCREMLEKYLERGLDVNLQNNAGETALHHAVLNPSVKVIMAGMDTLYPRNNIIV